jgi:hypothetical protein
MFKSHSGIRYNTSSLLLAHTDEIQRSFKCRLLGGRPDMAGKRPERRS